MTIRLNTGVKVALSTLEDSELVHLARENHQSAFPELWRRYYQLTVAILRPYVYGEAEDAATEAFSDVWAQLLRGGGPHTHFKAYVIRVAKRRAYRINSENQRYAGEPNEEMLGAAEDAEMFEAVETRAHISSALNAIPERWQAVLWLAAVEQKSRSEMGEVLGLSLNSTSALIGRAKNGFRQAYELAAA